MEFDYLDLDGALFPKKWFIDCFYLIVFTKNKCRPCKVLLDKLKCLNTTKHTNLVPVVISMDKSIDEWDKCFKPENWLAFPFFPIENRNQLFKKFRVDRLPFLVMADDKSHFIIPNETTRADIDVLENYIEFTISCFNVEEFEII